MNGRTRQWFAARAATDLLHAPVSIYECHLGSWRLTQDADGGWRPLTYREAAEVLPGYLSRSRLHPRGVPPGRRAPVLRLLGVPGDRVLRADGPVRDARMISVTWSTGCTRQASGCWSTGWSGTSPRTTGRWRALTARRCTSTPTRGWASTRTGAPWCSTTGATRSATSCSPTRCTGSRSSTSTACASTRSPRCSTWTTRAGRASGSPTGSAAGRTWRPSTSSRKSTRWSTSITPRSCWSPRNPRPGRRSPARPTWAGSASGSSGTWAG